MTEKRNDLKNQLANKAQTEVTKKSVPRNNWLVIILNKWALQLPKCYQSTFHRID
jgi:hypothetical protein